MDESLIDGNRGKKNQLPSLQRRLLLFLALAICASGRASTQDLENTGSLSVVSLPTAASVYVDGRLAGQTPLTLEHLPAGDHRVRVLKPSYLENSRIVTVARRAARNSQLILLEESHLAKVTDPAAGSGAIEELTNKLCTAAWNKFQEIEAHGGVWTALENGFIQSSVASVRSRSAR